MIKVINKLKSDKSGVTLMELLTAVTIFSVIMLSAMQIFKLVIEGQRNQNDSGNQQ